MVEKDKIIVFENRKIRRTWFNDEWWFSVVDVIGILTQTERARKYWSDLKVKLQEEGFEPSEEIGQLKLVAGDNKLRLTDCANTKNIFRIIQSIPSSRAEPFKRWLAKVGYERVQEIENPELAQVRMKEIYEQKGYSKSWIDKRLRGIAVRQDLTDEWKDRGVDEGVGFAILTNDIMRATFDKDVKEYKDFKALDKENLRDHMDDIELILTMLGEATTTRFTRERDSEEFGELRRDAVEGGGVAGNARREIESLTKEKVISDENHLEIGEKKVPKKKKKILEVKNE